MLGILRRNSNDNSSVEQKLNVRFTRRERGDEGRVVCATDYFIFIPIEPVGEKKEFP